MKFGKETFEELIDMNDNGIVIDEKQHDIKIISCSDWKAAACLEGTVEF